MTNSTRNWLHGAAAAAIGGGATAITTMVVDPSKFNIGDGGLLNLLSAFGISALIGLMLFLKQSPLPSESVEVKETVEKTTTVTATPSEK